MRYSPNGMLRLLAKGAVPLLAILLSTGIVGLVGALSAASSDVPLVQSKSERSEALALDRDIYYWRGALLGPAAASRGNPIGMFVGSVAPDSSAAKAKLEAGDIVVALNGLPISTARLLALAVADRPSGPVIKIRVWRDGTEKQLSLLVPSADPAGISGAPLGAG